MCRRNSLASTLLPLSRKYRNETSFRPRRWNWKSLKAPFRPPNEACHSQSSSINRCRQHHSRHRLFLVECPVHLSDRASRSTVRSSSTQPKAAKASGSCRCHCHAGVTVPMITVEGIEHPEQADLLQQLGCQAARAIFARPRSGFICRNPERWASGNSRLP